MLGGGPPPLTLQVHDFSLAKLPHRTRSSYKASRGPNAHPRLHRPPVPSTDPHGPPFLKAGCHIAAPLPAGGTRPLPHRQEHGQHCQTIRVTSGFPYALVPGVHMDHVHLRRHRLREVPSYSHQAALASMGHSHHPSPRPGPPPWGGAARPGCALSLLARGPRQWNCSCRAC